MKIVIGLGSAMFVDREGAERFIPMMVDEATGLEYFDTDEASWTELDLVGEELTPQGITLDEYWKNIKELVKE